MVASRHAFVLSPMAIMVMFEVFSSCVVQCKRKVRKTVGRGRPTNADVSLLNLAFLLHGV